MSRRLRLSGLAITAGLAVALAAGCGGSSSPSTASSRTGAHGTLIVFGAGTLATPFTAELAAFKKQNPGVVVHSQFAASADMIKDVSQLGEPADVLGSAAFALIPQLMSNPARPHATWYVGFVSNQITFAYTSHSKGACR